MKKTSLFTNATLLALACLSVTNGAQYNQEKPKPNLPEISAAYEQRDQPTALLSRGFSPPAQEPVVAASDPDALFHSRDPRLNKNKQAAYHSTSAIAAGTLLGNQLLVMRFSRRRANAFGRCRSRSRALASRKRHYPIENSCSAAYLIFFALPVSLPSN